MDTIIKSLENLIKTNKGFFKTEKQRDYILGISDRHDNSRIFHGYSFVSTYILDFKGVAMIEQYSYKTLERKITWERKIGNKLTKQDLTTIKWLKKQIKIYEEGIIQLKQNKRVYINSIDNFIEFMNDRFTALENYKERLNKYQSN